MPGEPHSSSVNRFRRYGTGASRPCPHFRAAAGRRLWPQPAPARQNRSRESRSRRDSRLSRRLLNSALRASNLASTLSNLASTLSNLASDLLPCQTSTMIARKIATMIAETAAMLSMPTIVTALGTTRRYDSTSRESAGFNRRTSRRPTRPHYIMREWTRDQYPISALARLERVIICSIGSVMTLTHEGAPSRLAA